MFFVINIPPNTLEILPFQSYSCNKALPCLQDLGTSKSAKNSLHYHVRNLPIEKGKTLLDIGGGAIGAVSMAHAERGVDVTVIDQCNAVQSDVLKHYVVNLDEP